MLKHGFEVFWLNFGLFLHGDKAIIIRNLLFLSIQTTVTVSCYLSPLFVKAVHCIAGLVQFVYIYAELQSEQCRVCSFIS